MRDLPLVGEHAAVLRYAVAVAAAASSVLLREAFRPVLGKDLPMIISPLAVVVSALFGGIGPGLLTTALCMGGAAYFLLEPAGMAVSSAHDRFDLFAFFIVGVTITILSGAFHGSNRKARRISAAMERSSRRITDILSSITDCFFTTDRAGMVTEINENAAAYFGMTREAMLGRRLRDMLPNSGPIISMFEAAAEKNEEVHVERPSTVREGHWAEIHAYPAPEGTSVYFRDITERKQAEEALARESTLNAAIAEFSRALVASPSVEEISKLVLEHAKLLTHSQIAFVGYSDPDSDRLIAPLHRFGSCLDCEALDTCPVYGEMIEHWERIRAERRSIIANSNASVEIPAGTHAGTITRMRYLTAPAIVGGKLIGQVSVAGSERDYSEIDLHLVERLASLYAIAVQRNWADERVRESQERFRSLYESIPGGVLVQNREGVIVEANPGAAALLGISVEELRGMSSQDPRWRLIHEDGSPLLPDEYPASIALRTGASVRGAVVGLVRGRGLEPRWILVNAEPVQDSEAGDVEAAVVTFVDMTARKLALEALKEERDFTSAVLDTAGSLVIVLDSEGRIIRFNRACEEVTGYSFDEVKDTPFWEVLLAPEDMESVRAVFETLLHGNYPNRFENYWRTKTGERRLISWSNTTITERGETKFVIGTGIDVTDRRRAEAEVVRAREEAEAANAAKDRFLAVLSHELRTPLTPILMAAGMLQRDRRLPPDVIEELQMISRNVEAESNLINDLLDITRITRGKIALDLRTIDIRTVLDQTIEMCSANAASKGLHLRSEVRGSLLPVRADPHRLQQAVWNLVSNALKFTPVGGDIEIRAGNTNGDRPAAPGGVFIEVADTGIGIAPDVLPRIFDPFEQGDRLVTRRFGGLGLGLAIAKSMVELQGGTIRAFSAGKGKGATFRIELPAAQEQEAPSRPAVLDRTSG